MNPTDAKNAELPYPYSEKERELINNGFDQAFSIYADKLSAVRSDFLAIIWEMAKSSKYDDDVEWLNGDSSDEH